MATLNIDGVGPVTVDDSFAQLSPQDQQKTVDEIIATTGQNSGGGPQGSSPAPQQPSNVPSATPVAQTSPQAPAASASPPGGMLNAAEQSIFHGAPALLARGLAGATRAFKNLTSVPGEDPATMARISGDADSEDAYAAQQRQELAQNYQRPADVPSGVGDAVAGASGPLDAAGRVARTLGYQAAESAGPLAANLGMAVGGGGTGAIAATVRAVMMGSDFAFNLGGIRDANAAAGLDDKNTSPLDIANAAGQTALMSAAPGGSGVLSNLATAGAKGVAQSLLTTGGAAAQGGTVGTPGQIADQALTAGTLGMGFAGGHTALAKSAGTVVDAVTAGKAGANMKAFQAETSDWNDALQSASAQVSKQNPNMAPATVQQQAYLLAQKNGATPPSFTDLSPQAQNGMAELATVKMYDAVRQTMTDGMGKPDANPAPAQVFKQMLTGITQNLNETATLAGRAGLLTKDQVGVFNSAVSEAAKHNVQGGENGSDYGWFNTLRDQVSQLPLDAPITNQVLQLLRVADIASQASLLKNSKGPLERNAGTILGAAGALGGFLTGGVEHMVTGGLGAHLARAQGTSVLRGLDNIMGHGLPDILQRRNAIQSYADQNGLTAVADPQALNNINQQLAGLGPAAGVPTAPGGRVQPPPVASPQGIQPGPVTSPVRPTAAPGQPPTAPAPIPPQPAPAPVQAAPIAPVDPNSPASAMGSLHSALQAKAARLAQATAASFPSNRTAWSHAIAENLGVDHGAMMDKVQELAASNPELAQAIKGSNLPPQVFYGINNHVADLRDQGVIPRAAGAAPADGAGIANPQAYQAAIDQEAAAGNAARQTDPVGTALIQAQKSTKSRGAALDAYVASLPPKQRAAAETALRPLTAFGAKGTARERLEQALAASSGLLQAAE